ncbi:MAG: hypothetical protein K0B05_08925 [Bacteroidales bacterium]|nr:hypothetical protein [Bacteroidales bacterium]
MKSGQRNPEPLTERRLTKSSKVIVLFITVLLLSATFPKNLYAHCDGIDGPVVKAAIKAIETNNVKLVLIWVQEKDESYITSMFEKTLKLRTISPEARELADTYFFETLVRVHRAGEGAPYTGLKPAGTVINPAVKVADESVVSGSAKEVWTLLSNSIHNELHERFSKLSQAKDYDMGNIDKGREFVDAYVGYIHFVERVSNISEAGADSNQVAGNAHSH